LCQEGRLVFCEGGKRVIEWSLVLFSYPSLRSHKIIGSVMDLHEVVRAMSDFCVTITWAVVIIESWIALLDRGHVSCFFGF
jgi:hypothetical protein